MNNKRAQELIDKYLDGTATPEERLQVDASLNRHMESGGLRRTPEELEKAANRNKKAVMNAIGRPRTITLTDRLPYIAAAVILILVVGTWMSGVWRRASDQPAVDASYLISAADVLPGSNRASLTIADGPTIILSSTQRGVVVGDEITYTDGSKVVDESEGSMPLSSAYAILTTPKGGTYQVMLSDGTRVWLNAESSLRYPMVFTGKERIVEIVGEGYFEVVSDHAKPFRVISHNQEVEVLGTVFNISAYPDEPEVKTTLVEGAVRLVPLEKGREHFFDLIPGQQATVNGSKIAIESVDVSQSTAWKEGLFFFDGLSLQLVFVQLARWYDIDVVYDGIAPETRIYGMVDRNKPLKSVLLSLEKSGLAFKLTEKEGRRQLMVFGDE